MIFSRSTKFTRSSEITISIDHTPLNKVHTTKFLGVTIDDKLTWSDHISSISKTISRNVCVQSNFVASFLLLLQHLFIILAYLPHLTYCNIIWARASTTKLNSLSIIQKRAIRICLTVTFMYKCVNGLCFLAHPRHILLQFVILINTIPDHAITSFYRPPAHHTLFTLSDTMGHVFRILLTCRSRVNLQSANSKLPTGIFLFPGI